MAAHDLHAGWCVSQAAVETFSSEIMKTSDLLSF